MGEAMLSRLYAQGRFLMTRFLVFTLVGALSLAGSTGLAFGQNGQRPAHPTPQAKKAQPKAAPGKRPASNSPNQMKKSPKARRPLAQGKHAPSNSPNQMKKSPSKAQRPPAKGNKSPRGAQKPPAKRGTGSKPGDGSYSWDDYKRDLLKDGKEFLDGELEELPGDLEIAGAAAEKDVPGVIGGVIKNAPDILRGKAEELQGEQDAAAATGRFLGARFNDFFKSKGPAAKPKNGAQKPNQRPVKPKSGAGR
jgi:hypothetical protein